MIRLKIIVIGQKTMTTSLLNCNIPVSSAKSQLRVYDLPAEWQQRLPTCVREIDSALDYHPPITMYGKVCHQQRSVGFFSDISKGYHYSTQLSKSKPMTHSLEELMHFVNGAFGCEFNGILINKYESGEEYIGRHSDDKTGLAPEVGVVLISVGTVRKFRIRNKNGQIIADVPTDPAKIIQMWGDFQKEFTHEIPVEKRVQGVRYSLTFRQHTV